MPGVSKEQIAQARNADLFAYLQTYESGVLKRDGPNYRHREHDSLVYVTGKGYWYWNSRGKRINALDYLTEIRGYGLVDAVNRLTDGAVPTIQPYKPPAQDHRSGPPLDKRPFYLPWQKKCASIKMSLGNGNVFLRDSRSCCLLNYSHHPSCAALPTG